MSMTGSTVAHQYSLPVHHASELLTSCLDVNEQLAERTVFLRIVPEMPKVNFGKWDI